MKKKKRNAVTILMESLKGRNYLGDVDISGSIISWWNAEKPE
jgi:hypothetical protein